MANPLLHEVSIRRASVPPDTILALIDEAEATRPSALAAFRPDYHLDEDDGLHGPLQARVSGPGPALAAFHREFALDLARSLAGVTESVFPTRSSYLYFSEGDFAMPHHDVVHAHITVIVDLAGRSEALIMYPRLGKIESADLNALNSNLKHDQLGFERDGAEYFGDRLQGIPVSAKFPGEAIAIQGRHVPHGRFEQHESAVMCACCYAMFKPTPGYLVP